MKTKKILKIIGIIILIIIVLILVHTLRNYIILKNIEKNFSKYESSTNFSIKSVATDADGATVTMKYYEKDNKQAVFIEYNKNGKIAKITMYNNGERTDIFYDNNEGKTAELNSGTTIDVQVYNALKTDNNWQTFLFSIPTRIKSTKHNEKDCYTIKNFPSSFEKEGIYIEKDTGLLNKNILNSTTTEKEYTFDDVDDAIFTEPDISQYTLKEK